MMGIELGRVFLLALFVIAANLPFLTHRLLGVLPLWRARRKPFWAILLEWLALFLLMAGVSAFIEMQLYGKLYPQGGHFYFIALFLFAVFAFPGYVYRYLMMRSPDGVR